MKQVPKNTPPWKKKAPKKTRQGKLTPEEKAEVKTRAEKAGCPYPNLVDNMAVIRAQKNRPRSHANPELDSCGHYAITRLEQMVGRAALKRRESKLPWLTCLIVEVWPSGLRH